MTGRIAIVAVAVALAALLIHRIATGTLPIFEGTNPPMIPGTAKSPSP